MNNVVFTVIGVAPPHFIGVNAIFGPDLWVPAAMAERLFPNSMQNALTDRDKAAFLGVGRLKPHVTGRRRGPTSHLASASGAAYPATNEGHTATVRPLREILLAVGGSTASDAVRQRRAFDRRRNRVADRVLERGEPAAGAVGGATAGDGGPPGNGREPLAGWSASF